MKLCNSKNPFYVKSINQINVMDWRQFPNFDTESYWLKKISKWKVPIVTNLQNLKSRIFTLFPCFWEWGLFTIFTALIYTNYVLSTYLEPPENKNILSRFRPPLFTIIVKSCIYFIGTMGMIRKRVQIEF